jgi:signal transduction histidine kinase/DNA-binding response OmpR family regulator
MKLNALAQRLTIGAQLWLGLGAILILVALLGGVAWRQADSLWAETQGLYDHPLQVRRAVGEIKADILAMHRGMKDALLADNDAELTQALQEIDVYEADARRQFGVVYDRYLGPRTDIEAAERAFVAWQAIRAETIRLLRAGQTAEARARTKPTGAGGRHVDLMLAALQKVSDFSLKRGDTFYADAFAQRDALRVRLALVLGGILLLAAGISYGLLASIRGPLHELTVVANQYRQGQLDARSRYSSASANEFAVLATTFNALADTVQAEIQSRANTAAIADVMLQEMELAGFCRALLAALLEHTGSQVGAVYLLNEAKTAFEHYAAIGLTAAGRAAFDAAAPEGEFGAALATRQIRHITEIPPQTRFDFAAVSGEFRPAAILTIPILAGQEVVALISLASLRAYTPAAVRLVNDIWSVLSARLNGVLAYRQIRSFAERLDEQNRELEALTRELRLQADELNEQNRELAQQKQFLDEANRLKSAFLSNMSHELRTPLNSVIALAGVLGRRLRNAIPEEEYSYLEVIERNGRHLLALINDILDLSRIEAGRADLSLSAFAVHDLAAEVIGMLELQAEEKGIALRNEVAGDLPPIRSDLSKCRHILQNLVGNAVKFTEAGRVTVAAAQVDGAVQIIVRDTGIGISPEQLPYIFDEFRQADESTSRKYGGSGLGLAIARKYTLLLQGGLTVESAPGQGSVFTLTLPLTLDAATAARDGSEALHARASTTAAGPAEPEVLPAGRGQRILLVEDSEPAIVQLTDILAEHGYRVQVARNGREALALVAPAEDAPALPAAMILDLMMPEVDGFEVLRAVRGNPATAQLPVLILTAKHVTPEELSFLQGNHIQELIQKGDVSKAELLAAVGKLVAPAPTASQPHPGVAQRATAAQVPRADGRPLILVVEDNLDSLKTARAVLGDQYEVIEGTDGQAGVAQARTHRPDLILMDIALPGLDGVAALAAIRADATLAHTPVIALTASAMKGDRETILAHGFDGYVAKPIDAELLVETIRESLNPDS